MSIFDVSQKTNHILNKLTIVIDQRIINRDHSAGTLPRARILLHQFQSSGIDRCLIPI